MPLSNKNILQNQSPPLLSNFTISLPASKTLSVMTGRELLKVETQSNPILEDLLCRKDALLLCATSGLGKSLMINQIAITGGMKSKPSLFNEFKITKNFRTLFVQAENSDQAVAARILKKETQSKNMCLQLKCIIVAVLLGILVMTTS
ncbi:hypothetical protein [Halodesulfovibrio sp.]|jgi:hypothetical protein|uniref:hypothetical protein n=1 Tax=Halodesulfovibrio sp. TaxID=1912772 RepID=UPI0026010F53|nr:hypothetical protein [Halodesulfovibrio sp.]MCT4628023.1 hypothetical protein [Halodesulfovibrio sp.]